jgi:uncharacterized DUF497 family protein
VEFEYDPAKSDANQEKHEIDFEAARKLWDDEDRVVIPARSDSEPRFALLALSRGHIWIAFYTVRGTAVRIISVRRARKNEAQLYESATI